MGKRNSNSYPLISVVTVNYNHSSDTIEFLESIYNSSYKNLEVIVIDNGSEPGDAELIKNKFKDIALYRVEKNIGFAPANNIGIRNSTGEYILSINNDMVVDKDFLFPLLKVLQENPSIGMVTPKIYFYDEPRNIQSVGYTEMNPFTLRNKSIGFNEVDRGQYNNDQITAYAHGGACMVSSELVKDVGLMSELFFLYYEDIDWCRRIRYAGYQICYVHNSLVYHKDSVTTGANSPYKTYYINRGRLIYLRRHIKFPLLIYSVLYVFFIALPKALFVFLIKKEFAQMRALLKAYGWFLKHMFNKNMTCEPVTN